MNVSWPTIIFTTSILAFPLAANAGKKESCLAQVKLAKSVVELRLTELSKQSLLDLNKKNAAGNPAMGKLADRIVEVVYAAEKDELNLVPGMIYAECMK